MRVLPHHSHILFTFLTLFIAVGFIGFPNPILAADNSNVKANHKGITLVGKFLPPGADFGVPIMDPKKALGKLRDAISLIYKKSPISAAKIKTLKEHGDVVIIYDPQYPNEKINFASLHVAKFLPLYLDQNVEGKQGKSFLTIISRHGVKWPIPELAAVIIHELVGHAMQHLEGRLETMRSGDHECEAWLYTEMAHQNFAVDKFSHKMVKFRKQLLLNCDGFLAHLRKNDPKGLAIWEVLNPNVPKLLTHFEKYLDDLRSRGVMQEALKYKAELIEKRLSKVFKEGSPKDQYEVGLTYQDGIYIKPDPALAVKWFQQSAERGYAPAQQMLNRLNAKSKNAIQAPTKKAHMNQTEEEPKSAEEQYKLGTLHSEGQGVSKNPIKAMQWYRKAAEQDYAPAQHMLGSLYNRGKGLPKDLVKAARWYQKAAEQGYAPAQQMLGSLYKKGKGLPKDLVKAATWYRKAAEQGIPESQYILSTLYNKGLGVEKDLVLATQWLRMAAEQDHYLAQYMFAVRNRYGQGTKRDDAEAVKWYRKSAEQGYAKAQISLGHMYEKGKGIQEDYVKAAQWYREAVKLGDKKAITNLAKLIQSHPEIAQ